MNCPDPEYIEHYVCGRLGQSQSAEFEAHLEDCSKCSSRTAEACENETLLSEIREFQTRTKDSLLSADEAVRVQKIGTIERAQELLGSQYRVVKKVGQGAAGEVFQAIDTILDRPVAVKFLNKEYAAESTTEERWREARLIGQLNHPNIAQVYHIGEHEKIRFIVMEWVEGLPLTEVWGKSVQQRLGIYLQVLDAMAAAHKRGIIHRDIKPSNILVNSASRAKVLDFGIAVDRQFLESVSDGCYRGTPAFSAPEQITPPFEISTATDVFALGILLYQLLTDTLPFPQTDTKELFQAIRTEYPELPSAIQEKVPIALQNICLKALEKNPHQRYVNAQGLSDDINRYLRGEKVWSMPSFLTDKIQQEVFYHRQKLKVWRDNELVTEKEYDKLEHIYERVIAAPDPSIIEARKLSLSQVCLYLGGWLSVLGCFVLFYKTWDQIPIYWRPTPAVAAATLITLFGIMLWRKKESRLAVGFFATANLLIPITILLTLGQWEILSAANYFWGTETIYQILSKVGSHLIVGNLQLYISSWCWLAFSFVFLRLTRSSIFVLFSIIAFLVWLTTSYIIAGMENWAPDIIAGRYLFAGIGLFILGVVFDRHRLTHYAWSPCVIGLLLIVGPLSIIAVSENTLFGWLLSKPAGLTQNEQIALSFACNGLIYLGLATLCRFLGTILQRSLAQILNWLGPLHILAPLRVLDLDALSVSESHRVIYRTLLPIASFAFVFGSVTRQMKSFFFSGLGGIAFAVHKFTVKYLDKYFAWPISLIITGIIWMLVSWLVPRWKAGMALKNKRQLYL
jgi:serine/threonine protein kinase